MDNSTQNVTLLAGFINDVLAQYEHQKEDYTELFDIVEGTNLSNPQAFVPMSLYNELCTWVEENLGQFNLIKVGRSIGERAYGVLLDNGIIENGVDPVTLLTALRDSIPMMIKDPKNRGWEILDHGKDYILLRRTQTFNRLLQFGFLKGLVSQSGATRVNVEFVSEVVNGAEFDEYRVTWEA